jgi:hypothetical protein
MSAEQVPWNRYLRHLEDRIAAMADDLRADLDQLLLERRQRAVLDQLGRRHRPQKIAEIIGERVKLKTHGVGGEGAG